MPFYLESALPTLELPKIPHLIDPWMAAGSVTLVFGPPSAGKSLWMTSVARALASGTTLFGAYACAQARVLIVQADMPTVAVVERAQAAREHVSPNIGVWLTDNAVLDVLKLDTTQRATFAEALAFAPHVVFVDTLRKTHHLDENESGAPDRVYAAWRALFPGASFVFLHHSRKIPTNPNVPEATIREAFRGSIAWAASADTIIAIRRVRRKGSREWTIQQRFIRTRTCEEPESLLLRRTPEMLLEPTRPPSGELEAELSTWLMAHPDATQPDAVTWLTSLRNEAGKARCERRRAYRIYDRVKPL